MHIRFTLAADRRSLYLPREMIMSFEPDPTNPLVTLISSTIVTDKGYKGWRIFESPDEVQFLVNKAHACELGGIHFVQPHDSSDYDGRDAQTN